MVRNVWSLVFLLRINIQRHKKRSRLIRNCLTNKFVTIRSCLVTEWGVEEGKQSSTRKSYLQQQQLSELVLRGTDQVSRNGSRYWTDDDDYLRALSQDTFTTTWITWSFADVNKKLHRTPKTIRILDVKELQVVKVAWLVLFIAVYKIWTSWTTGDVWLHLSAISPLVEAHNRIRLQYY